MDIENPRLTLKKGGSGSINCISVGFASFCWSGPINLQDNNCCHSIEVHSDAVQECAPNQLSDEIVLQLAAQFKELADPTRILILSTLGRRELCVCDLAHVLGMTQATISHRLRYARRRANDGATSDGH